MTDLGTNASDNQQKLEIISTPNKDMTISAAEYRCVLITNVVNFYKIVTRKLIAFRDQLNAITLASVKR